MVSNSKSNLSIIVDPQTRQNYLNKLLEIDGLSHLKEDPQAVYCPISLTQTPQEIKPFVLKRQKALIEKVLPSAGLIGYDPSSSPFSPDKKLEGLPQEIYLINSSKIISSRYFIGHNLMASTGFGVELEKASRYNRIAVILHDQNIRITRMQPSRVVYLQYQDFTKQLSDFIKVFQLLSQYEPGMGILDNQPILLGFKKGSNQPVNLEQLIYDTFPHLKYQFVAQAKTINLSATNPELFIEHKELNSK